MCVGSDLQDLFICKWSWHLLFISLPQHAAKSNWRSSRMSLRCAVGVSEGTERVFVSCPLASEHVQRVGASTFPGGFHYQNSKECCRDMSLHLLQDHTGAGWNVTASRADSRQRRGLAPSSSTSALTAPPEQDAARMSRAARGSPSSFPLHPLGVLTTITVDLTPSIRVCKWIRRCLWIPVSNIISTFLKAVPQKGGMCWAVWESPGRLALPFGNEGEQVCWIFIFICSVTAQQITAVRVPYGLTEIEGVL